MDAFYTEAILSARTTLHLSWRFLYRTSWAIELHGRATAGAGVWRWALPLFLAYDVVVWLVLRRSSRSGLWWRLPLDAADMAFWSLSPVSPGGFYDPAVFVGIPLAAETGVRLGAPALVVPAFGAAVTGAVRATAGERAHPFTFLWLVLAVGVGWALNAYCRRLHREAERERAQRRSAESEQAFLAGQNAVAMGASSVVDALEGVVPVLGRPDKGSALWTLAAGWKADLGRRTRSAVVYLGDAVAEWERRYNQHPDLASRVELRLGEGDGTTMLSGAQAAWLHGWLDAQRLRGPVDIAVRSAPDRRPGAPVHLAVGPAAVDVPADREVVVRPVDPGPVTFLFAFGQTLTLASEGSPNVPVPALCLLLGLCLGFGLWAHRRLSAHGRAARPAIVYAAVLFALLHTAIGSATARNGLLANGNTAFVAVGWILLAYLGGLYWHGLPRRHVGVLLGGFVGCGLLMLWLAPGPHYLRSFISAVMGNLATFPTSRRISIALAGANDAYARRAREQDREVVDAAFRRGQATVLDLVRQARDDGCRQVQLLRASIGPQLATIVTERLEEVDRRLAGMDRDGEPLSSTTTS